MEGLNLEPRFLTWALSKPLKALVQKKNQMD
jgi:hypothetical protein